MNELTHLNQKHVFISYCRNNSRLVDKLSESLKSYGIDVWLDREQINPGESWENAIEQAIQKGAFFIACFSKQYLDGNDGVRYEELNIAIEQIRRKPDNHIWFIPVLLNKCEIPNMTIRKGKKLNSLHYLELYKDWEKGIEKVLSVVQPKVDKTTDSDSKAINPNAKYVDNFTDYFDGITDEEPLRTEVAVNEDGRIIFFYTHNLKEKLKQIEYFIEDKRFVLLSEKMTSRYFGMPLKNSVNKHLKKASEILMVRLDLKTGNAMEGWKLPLKVYD